MSTTARRFKIIRVLSQRRFETVTNLAYEFGVTERTILRDIYEISEIIPIYCKQGRYEGGIYIDSDYNMDKAYMQEDELNLLKKVIDCSKSKEILSLTSEEQKLLEKLIIDYSIPNKNI